MKTLLHRHGQLLLYGLSLSLLLFALKWLQWKFMIIENSVDIYVGLIAVFFTLLGIWVAQQMTKPKVTIIEKEVYVSHPEAFVFNETEWNKLNLSPREWDVLQLITQGMSNAEIAEKLCVSLSTIKTHASNVFVKMEVKSRTQAIEKAKRLKITP
jgi:NarL family two-component system response regulator LiaR